jgi:hypothetical protein
MNASGHETRRRLWRKTDGRCVRRGDDTMRASPRRHKRLNNDTQRHEIHGLSEFEASASWTSGIGGTAVPLFFALIAGRNVRCAGGNGRRDP